MSAKSGVSPYPRYPALLPVNNATSIGCFSFQPEIIVYPISSQNSIPQNVFTSCVLPTPVGQPKKTPPIHHSLRIENIPVIKVSIIASFASFCPAILLSNSDNSSSRIFSRRISILLPISTPPLAFSNEVAKVVYIK